MRLDQFRVLAKAFFQRYGLVRHHIDSFNVFIREGMQRVVNEIGGIEPVIIPEGYESYKIKFGKINVGFPIVREADGSSSRLYPMEARLRDLTYSAPITLELIVERDGIREEPVKAEIGMLPIMVRSERCWLHGMSEEEMVEMGEDPYDPGGYFIINGTERVIVSIEDLIPNLPLIEKNNDNVIVRLFSEVPGFRIPHQFEFRSDGLILVSWARVPFIPISIMFMALGVTSDEEMAKLISEDPRFMEEIMVNLEELEDISSPEDAMDYIGKKLKIGQGREYRIERVQYMIDNYLLPHVGRSKADRYAKAVFLGMIAERMLLAYRDEIPEDDKDHYANKRLKLTGELMEQLFRAAFKTLVNDMQYSFERMVRRGREPRPGMIIRSQLLTSRIESALSTGYWVGGRTGVSQHLQRLNFWDTLSHLRRVMSPLTSNQPHFEARALHPTHWGKLCVAETPEGQNIGLRKNLAIMAKISYDVDEKPVLEHVERILKGLEG